MNDDNFPYEKYNYVLFESEEEYNIINRSSAIYIPGNFICSEFIKRILMQDNYFDYAKRYFNGEINEFKVGYVKNGDICGNMSYSKNEIIRAMDIYIKENNLRDKNILERFQELRNIISVKAFKNKFENNTFTITVDKNKYDIEVKDIIELLSNSTYEFESICDDNNIKELYGVPKSHFLYAVREFIEKEKINDNYDLTNSMERNIKDILKYYYDMEACNKYLETRDTLYQKIELDPEFENEVLKDMPNDLSLLEKCLYIYVKLCTLLTYDEEYFALNQEGEILEKHKDYKNVLKINKENNRVTCYEFNLLYTKFLSKLGVNFESSYRNYLNEEGYGKTHVELGYRVGKYLVFADSVESILEGDIANSKINQRVTGLRALNKNTNTQEEFNDSLNKVYKLIYKERKKDSFEDIVKEYQKKTSNYHDIAFQDKVRIFLDKLNSINYQGVDAMAYILHLKRIIFNYNELNFNIKFNIISDANTSNNDLARLSLIIRTNEDDFVTDYMTKYYLFTPFNGVKEVTYDEIKALFDNGVFSYLERDDNLIPGINRRGAK